MAKVLEYAFGTKEQQAKNHGMPFGKINVQQGYAINHSWASYCSVLAEFGTIALEWSTLAAETGNKSYLDHVTTVNSHLMKMAPPPEGAWYNTYHADTLTRCHSYSTFGGPGDSFYEYMMKFYLLTGKQDAAQLDWLKQTTKMLKTSLVYRQENEKMPVMMVEQSGPRKVLKMGHLACFAGGFWGLTSTLNDEEEGKDDMQIAKGVTRSCRESYVSSSTGIGPEAFNSQGKVYAGDKYYILRPETVESYFYMYRLTKEEKYREWAWDFVEALEAHCRAPFGYAGLKDVNTGEKNDVQESFFLAETLK